MQPLARRNADDGAKDNNLTFPALLPGLFRNEVCDIPAHSRGPVSLCGLRAAGLPSLLWSAPSSAWATVLLLAVGRGCTMSDVEKQ